MNEKIESFTRCLADEFYSQAEIETIAFNGLRLLAAKLIGGCHNLSRCPSVPPTAPVERAIFDRRRLRSVSSYTTGRSCRRNESRTLP